MISSCNFHFGTFRITCCQILSGLIIVNKMSNLQQLITPDANWIFNYNTPIIKQTNNDLATDKTEDVLLAIDEEKAIKKWNDWEKRHILKKGEIRVADGTLTSTFIVPLKEFSNGYETIQERVADLISKSKNFRIHLEEDPNVREVQIGRAHV